MEIDSNPLLLLQNIYGMLSVSLRELCNARDGMRDSQRSVADDSMEVCVCFVFFALSLWFLIIGPSVYRPINFQKYHFLLMRVFSFPFFIGCKYIRTFLVTCVHPYGAEILTKSEKMFSKFVSVLFSCKACFPIRSSFIESKTLTLICSSVMSSHLSAFFCKRLNSFW